MTIHRQLFTKLPSVA